MKIEETSEKLIINQNKRLSNNEQRMELGPRLKNQRLWCQTRALSVVPLVQAKAWFKVMHEEGRDLTCPGG
jgi:hypothetical protein